MLILSSVHVVALLVCVLSSAVTPGLAPAFALPSTFDMPVIARLRNTRSHPPLLLPCGDADRNGYHEFYAWTGTTGEETLCAFECREGNQYVVTPLASYRYDPLAFGDVDRDGRSDLLLKAYMSGRQWGKVIESPDSFSLPRDTFTFARDAPTNAGCCAVSDMDLDSAIEVTVFSSRGVRVYECTGNDSFAYLGFLDSLRTLCFFSSGDLDRDGKPEIAAGTMDDSTVFIYEATDNNQFEAVAVCTTLHAEARVTAIADDMDRDGRKELLVLSGASTRHFLLTAFEADTDNHYVKVWEQLVMTNWYPGSQCYWIGTGDVDGDGVEEFSVTYGDSVRLFRCTGPDQYSQVWNCEAEESRSWIYDLNRNGRAELVVMDCDDTLMLIREYRPSGISEQVRRGLEQIICGPSVVRRGIAVRLATGDWGLVEDVEVEVVDVAGRVVAVFGDCGTGAEWQTGSVRPGAYFIRASSAGQSVVRKLLVVE